MSVIWQIFTCTTLDVKKKKKNLWAKRLAEHEPNRPNLTNMYTKYQNDKAKTEGGSTNQLTNTMWWHNPQVAMPPVAKKRFADD